LPRAKSFAFVSPDQKFIQFVAELQQGQVRLQLQTNLGRINTEQGIHFQRRPGFVVKGFNMGPFQSRHVQGRVMQAAIQRGSAWRNSTSHRPKLRKVKDCEGCCAR
jgi:hypothetical protein